MASRSCSTPRTLPTATSPALSGRQRRRISGTVTDAVDEGRHCWSDRDVLGIRRNPHHPDDHRWCVQLHQCSGGNLHRVGECTGYTGQTSSTLTVTAGGSVTQNFALTARATSPSVVETFGAANSGATGGTTLTATTATATGSGDLLVVALRARGASAAPTVSGISDNSSGLNTWKRATGAGGKSDADAEIWYTTDAASVTSIAAAVSGTASLAMTVLDISGASSTPLDQVMGDTGSGTTATTLSTATTTQASEIAVADIGWNGATNTYPLSGATSGYVSAPTAFWQSTVTGVQAGSRRLGWSSPHRCAELYRTLKASVAWTGVIATFG